MSNLIKESRPATAGVFSGLGEVLVQDDIGNKDEWFSFKIKDSYKANSETPTEAVEWDEDKKRKCELRAGAIIGFWSLPSDVKWAHGAGMIARDRFSNLW